MGMMPKVYIINGDEQYKRMFFHAGWAIVDRLSKADLVQFTGGSDVTPHMYSEPKHPRTTCNAPRDTFEAAVFKAALQAKIPMAGICRGGQFLNVMCGGSMWQDVDAHAITGTHDAVDKLTNAFVQVSSTHHQMMRPSKNADILMTARRSSRKERMSVQGAVITVMSDDPDIEAVFYEAQRCVCFQPHPEYSYAVLSECREAYFNYLEHYFALKGGV